MKAKRAENEITSRRPGAAQVLDVEATAAFIGVCTDTVYKLFTSGDLPGRKVGREWRTTTDAVLHWIENTTKPEKAQSRRGKNPPHQNRSHSTAPVN